MLKYKHNREKKEFYLEAEGSPIDLCADVSLLVEELYRKMKEDDPKMAEDFRNAFKQAITEDVPFVDDAGRIKMIKEKLNDLLEEILCS